MNTIKHVVTKVTEGPKKEVLRPEEDRNSILDWDEIEEETGQRKIVLWKVEVKANSYGRIGTNILTFDTKEQANQVEPGYEFTA